MWEYLRERELCETCWSGYFSVVSSTFESVSASSHLTHKTNRKTIWMPVILVDGHRSWYEMRNVSKSNEYTVHMDLIRISIMWSFCSPTQTWLSVFRIEFLFSTKHSFHLIFKSNIDFPIQLRMELNRTDAQIEAAYNMEYGSNLLIAALI